MILKQVNPLSKNDIDGLIENAVREGRSIEYKSALPKGKDEDKREFLADISSFANSSGGHILYGIIEKSGTPIKAKGLENNIDDEILRLESMIRTSIEPRIIGVHMRAIEGFPSGPVLIIQIPKSWASPCMVTYKGGSRFFIRNSAGKHQMDIHEIRSAFSQSAELPEIIRKFRDERLTRIIADETPVVLKSATRLILHLLPITSFTNAVAIDISSVGSHFHKLMPISTTSPEHRFNIDGIVTFNSSVDPSIRRTYTQLFRMGGIEAVYAGILTTKDPDRKLLGRSYESHIISSLIRYLKFLRDYEMDAPFQIMMSLVGVRGVEMSLGSSFEFDEGGAPIDRDMLILPDVLIDENKVDRSIDEIALIMKPTFDAVWNSCGYPNSLNFDSSGKWIKGT